MRIGVISDSHGDICAVKKAITMMGDVDIIIHLGDHCRDAQIVSKELNRDIIYVRGNCDYSYGTESEKILNVSDKRVLITHGHRYNVKSGYLDLYYKALQEEADLVLFGHTHFAETFEKDNILFVNPGSVSRPRGADRTYAVVIVDGGHMYAAISQLL